MENDGPTDHSTSTHHIDLCSVSMLEVDIDFCSISMLVGHKIILHPGGAGASQNYTIPYPTIRFFSASKRSQRFTPALLGDIWSAKIAIPEKLTNVDHKKGSFQNERVKGLSSKQEEAAVSLPSHHFSGANC